MERIEALLKMLYSKILYFSVFLSATIFLSCRHVSFYQYGNREEKEVEFYKQYNLSTKKCIEVSCHDDTTTIYTLKKGKKNGMYLSFTNGGVWRVVGRYKNNNKVGEWRFYRSSYLYLVVVYRNGKEILCYKSSLDSVIF